MESGQLEAAEEALLRARTHRDSHVAAEAAYQLGKLRYLQERLDQALDYFEQAVSSQNDDVIPKGLNGRGVVLTTMGKVEEAITAYEAAMRSGHADASARAAWNLGNLLRDRRDFHGAEAAYAMAAGSGHVEIAPLASIEMGFVLEELGRGEAGEEAIKGALDAADRNVASSAAMSLGLLLAAHGDRDGARSAFETALSTGDGEQVEQVREYLRLLSEAETRESDLTRGSLDDTSGAPAHLLSPDARELLSPLDQAIALYADDPDGAAQILREFRRSNVFGLGHPAGDLTEQGGTESDLLHFTVEEAPEDLVVLPVFTQPSIVERAVVTNPMWASLSVIQVAGGDLFDNVDEDVTIVVNPWSRLEYHLPRRSADAAAS